MLKVFRDNLKYLSWVLWFVILVFILFVFVDFGGTVPGGSAPSDAAATVGEHEISFGEFERSYRRAEDFYRQTYGEQFSSELARQIGLPRQVLDSLIADRILLSEARRMGLAVTDREVRQEILDLPVFQGADGKFIGQAEYARVLRANGLSVDQFESDLRSDLLVQKVRGVLEQNVFVPDAAVEEAYRDEVETASIRFLRLPASAFRGEVELEPEAVAAYFEEHAETFRIPERRIAHYLLIDRAEVQQALAVDQAEVERFYRENRDDYTSEEQVRARHILLRTGDERSPEEAERLLAEARRRVERGEDFGQVAAELSEDPGSKGRDGDLGYFGRGQMVPEFEEAAFGGEPGQMVGPVRSPFGVHLIEVVDRRPAGVQPLEEVREEIESRLLTERAVTAAENKAQELARTVRDEGVENWDALAATEPGVSYQTTAPFAEDDHVEGIGRSTAFSVAAFALEEPGATSDPVRIARGWAILRLADIQPSRLPELDEVRGEVESALAETHQRELALERLRQAAAALGEDEDLEALAADLDVEVEESGPFGRGGSVGSLGRSPALVRQALALDEGAIGRPLMVGDDAVLFQVSERVRFDPQAFAEVRDATRQRLEQQRFAEMLAAVVDARRREMEVRLAPELIDNFDLLGDVDAGPAG